jgi:hypothetical protein
VAAGLEEEAPAGPVSDGVFLVADAAFPGVADAGCALPLNRSMQLAYHLLPPGPLVGAADVPDCWRLGEACAPSGGRLISFGLALHVPDL